jgi:hypothetical protein
MNCSHPACAKSLLDLELLALKLGPDHGALHYDLVDLFVCSRCEAEGATAASRSSPTFRTISGFRTRSRRQDGAYRSRDDQRRFFGRGTMVCMRPAVRLPKLVGPSRKKARLKASINERD